jgi:hypothetical protein
VVTEEMIATFLAFHNPEAQKEQMVYEIWEDGEVTLTKGGSLYGQRSCHSVWDAERYGAKTKVLLPIDRMPKKNYDGSHGCIQVADGRVINSILEVLFGKCHWNDRWYV